MPRENGTGPYGQKAGRGRGLGYGGGRGRMGGEGFGPEGFCICNKCGYKTEHIRGTRCMDMRCPNCDTRLVREGGYHDKRTRQKSE